MMIFVFYRVEDILEKGKNPGYPLPPARWHGKQTCLYTVGTLGTTRLNFICRSHNI